MGGRWTRGLRAACVGLLALAAPGCFLLRDAEISSMTPGGHVASGSLECWVELTFSGQPEGDARDVVLEFRSVVMPEPQRFDWAFIASHDQVPRGDFAGYRPNDATDPDAPPPLDSPIRVRVPLRSYSRVELGPGDDLELTATLYWAGARQHAVTRTLGHVYRSEGSPL